MNTQTWENSGRPRRDTPPSKLADSCHYPNIHEGLYKLKRLWWDSWHFRIGWRGI